MKKREQILYEHLAELCLDEIRKFTKSKLVDLWGRLLEEAGIDWATNNHTKRTHAQRFGDSLFKKTIKELRKKHQYVQAGLYEEYYYASRIGDSGDFGAFLAHAISVYMYEVDLGNASKRSKALATPLKYHGGKQTIAKKIVDLMPPHARYIEPFCGGAAVLFAKPLPEKAKRTDRYVEILNDLNGHVVNFWRVCRDERIALEHKLYTTPYSRDEYEKADLDEPGLSSVEMARRFFVQCRMSYKGMLGGGFYNPSTDDHPVVPYRVQS